MGLYFPSLAAGFGLVFALAGCDGSPGGSAPEADQAFADARIGDRGLDAEPADGTPGDGAAPDARPPADGASPVDGGLADATPGDADPADGASPPDIGPLDEDCRFRCTRAERCNLVRFADCAATCGDVPDDPLAARRESERQVCAETAVSCADLDRCLNPPPAEPWVLPDAVDDALCAAIDACVLDGCGLVSALADGRPLALRCVEQAVTEACPPDPLAVLMACQSAEDVACRALCTAGEVCGEVDDVAGCTAACAANALTDVRADRVAQVAELGCASAGTCAELSTCLEAAGPGLACDAHCAALEDCGQLEPGCDGLCCRAACIEEAPRLAHVAWRACVAEAADCAAVAGCAPAPALPCEARCAAEAACGFDEACLARCADQGTLDPEGAARTLACVLEAPACARDPASVDACRDGPIADSPCLDRCRARVGCDGPLDALGACIEACGRGDFEPWGEDPLCFAPAEAGGCPAEVDCPPQDVDACAIRCRRVAGCLGPEELDCRAACADDPLRAFLLDSRGECLDGSANCEAMAACFAPPPPPELVDFETFCARYDACDPVPGLACQAAWDFVGSDAARTCVYAGLDGCPPDAVLLVSECEGTLSADDGPCDRHCEALRACGVVDDLGACRRACRQQRAAAPEVDPAPCAAAMDCATVAGCAPAGG